MNDIVIIGAGPAGLSAAIHSARFGFKVVVLERRRVGGQVWSANLIENYPGIAKISGYDLMEKFVRHAEILGVEILAGEALNVSKSGKTFISKTTSGDLESKQVVLATGLEPIKLPLHKNTFYYPDPNQIVHKGKRVLVVGGGDSAFDEAISFAKKARSVTVAMRTNKPKALQRLVEKAVRAGVIIKTSLKDEEITAMKADVVVACVGKRQNLSIIDPSIRNEIFLAGDILHPEIRHVAVAVGDGIVAVEKYADHFKNR